MNKIISTDIRREMHGINKNRFVIVNCVPFVLFSLCCAIVISCGNSHYDPCSKAIVGGECLEDFDCGQGKGCRCGWCVLEECAGVINIAHPLDRTVRSIINKPKGDLYYEDVKGITSLGFTGDPMGYGVLSSIEGIQCLTGLREIYFTYNGTLSDISPLRHLIYIRVLQLIGNNITDITPISELYLLEELDLSENPDLSDIRPLSGLNSLIDLRISSSKVEDIFPLSDLISLAYVDLSWNRITNIGPLVDNLGIGAGDYVSVENNWIECADQATNIQTLRDRGVDLIVDCP